MIYPGVDSRLYPGVLFNNYICATLPESTPPSQNLAPFSTNVYVRPSQNLTLPPGIYPPFQQLYATLTESTPPPQKKKYYPTPLFKNCICATLPESTPPPQSQNMYSGRKGLNLGGGGGGRVRTYKSVERGVCSGREG